MKKTILIFALLLSASVFGQDTTRLNAFMDAWHQSASDANFDGYFNVMREDFVFLGTAPGERWKKDEFAKFSKPYFDKGKAWDFKASNRIWEFGAGKKIVWFDEDLDTWMEGCRGSGIMIRKGKEWKLVYYNLTVLIENEKIKEFIDLRQAPMPEEE